MIAGSFEFQDMKLDDRLKSLQAKFTKRLNLLEEQQSNAEKEFRSVLQALKERLEAVLGVRARGELSLLLNSCSVNKGDILCCSTINCCRARNSHA